MRLVRQLIGHVLDFCYPGVCASCEASSDGGAMLCDDCSQKLDALAAAGACDRCAMPLPGGGAGAPCPHCHGRGMTPFDRMIRLGVFDDPLKHLIHQFKYHRRWPLAEVLADRLIATERAKGLLTETQVLVPVPLHLRRHIARGYNQADVIARRIGGVCRISVVHAAGRIRNTETQTHMHSQGKACRQRPRRLRPQARRAKVARQARGCRG
ncbi:MAG: double zinc ribbon domain-containing protein [Tepidisphaeraceae bacterium]